ncbi:MAG: hypothetical protein IJW18_04420 [Lachnospiraceae bacterium]|nr:hypothetical protein [Lachnospiraceae bacterium]
MKTKDLFKELSNIDDKLIEEASLNEAEEGDVSVDKEGKRYVNGRLRNKIISYGAMAAGLLIVIGVGLGVAVNGNNRGEKNQRETMATEACTEPALETMVVNTKDMMLFEDNIYYTDGEEAVKGTLIGEAGQPPAYGTSDYVGCPVYLVEGHKGTLRVAVEKDGKVVLFRLREWGKEPNMELCKRVYGILSADDIESVRVEWNYDPNAGGYQGDVTLKSGSDDEKIAWLYDILSELILDAEGHREIVDKISKADYDRWVEEGNKAYTNETGSYVPAYGGTSAYSNNVHIIIRSNDGSEFDMDYYPKIAYISYFTATDELVDWIDSVTK